MKIKDTIILKSFLKLKEKHSLFKKINILFIFIQDVRYMKHTRTYMRQQEYMYSIYIYKLKKNKCGNDR